MVVEVVLILLIVVVLVVVVEEDIREMSFKGIFSPCKLTNSSRVSVIRGKVQWWEE